MTSCVSKKSADHLSDQRDSLSMVVAEKDSIINDIFFSLNQITENLTTIKEREKLISSSIDNNEIKKQASVQISEDIQTIDQLLQENKATIARLQRNASELKKANMQIGELNKTIKNLTEQVEARDSEISNLKEELKDMNIKVAKMNEDIASLNSTVDALSGDKNRLEGDVKSSADRMNTAYYILGTQKELLAKEIIYKSGFIGRTIRVNENRSLDSFTQIDIRNFNEVIIGKKDVTLVTTHPSESYELVMSDKGIVSSLEIKDKARFWEYSKVLVICYK